MTRVRYEDNICCCVPGCTAPRTMMYPRGKRRSRYCVAHLEANRATYNQSGRKQHERQPEMSMETALERAQQIVATKTAQGARMILDDQYRSERKQKTQTKPTNAPTLKYEAMKCTKWRKEADAMVEQIERRRSEKGGVR